MTPMKHVTAICGICNQGVEHMLFAAGVEEAGISLEALEDHEDQYGHAPEDFRFLIEIPHRKEVR